MLRLKNIVKIYKTKAFTQKALDDVSINFRESEFVSILGPSGSGKTTLLNIIGGLDHYTSGDIIIDGITTKKYKDRDWDAYRNSKIGFVFQSYNLIEHQNVLSNVELALTLSGVKRKKRVALAKEALEKVGLKDHMYKKPSELSGGQRQRVAIARAIVNNPKIILADEPTGALDTHTSVEIMNILKEISKDRLVIMVTHNEDLADEYSSRIINILDGKITHDSNPYDTDEKEVSNPKKKRTAMSLFTALSLSFNNLLTKKWRTFLTAFAGSIGIVGIALILSLSSSVQNYVNKTITNSASYYPLSINRSTDEGDDMSFSDISNGIQNTSKCQDEVCPSDDISPKYSNIKENNLIAFDKALKDNFENINKYISYTSYSYNTNYLIYDENGYDVSPSQIVDEVPMTYTTVLPSNKKQFDNNYELLKGKFPTNYDEIALVVDKNNNISLSMVYALNLKDRKDLKNMIEEYKKDKTKTIKLDNISYDAILNKNYKLVLNSSLYKKEGNIYTSIQNKDELNRIIANGLTLKVVGIMKYKDDSQLVGGKIGVTDKLTEYVINSNNESEIVKAQKSNDKINVFTGKEFAYGESYNNNLSLLGAGDVNNPSQIDIYPKSYNDKEKITKIIDDYNAKASKADKIVYTDLIKTVTETMNNITTIISTVLIALVAISLIVSSIMISIITYISVLERTKEIGILRALGARKKDIRRVFNSETIIEGFISGLLGILITSILCVPLSSIVESSTKISLNVTLDSKYALILIAISVVLTVIAGAIPSSMASKKDPVEALRSE